MAAASRAVRTPWVDLNASAILAISCTGTERTALVSCCCSVCGTNLMQICETSFCTKTWGQKTGDTLNSALFLFNSPSLDFTSVLSETPKVQRSCGSGRDAGPGRAGPGRASWAQWKVFFLTLEFCCGFHLEAEGVPPANPPSKPTLNCSKQGGGGPLLPDLPVPSSHQQR